MHTSFYFVHPVELFEGLFNDSNKSSNFLNSYMKKYDYKDVKKAFNSFLYFLQIDSSTNFNSRYLSAVVHNNKFINSKKDLFKLLYKRIHILYYYIIKYHPEVKSTDLNYLTNQIDLIKKDSSDYYDYYL